MRERFTEKFAARAQAAADAAAATISAASLFRERSSAAQAMGDISAEADRIATRLLSFTAEQIATQIHALQGEIARRRKALLGYDRLIVNQPFGLSRLVGYAIGQTSNQDHLAANIAPWRAAMAALMTDPEAHIEIELPEAVLPALPMLPTGLHPVTIMRAIPKPIPPEEPTPGPQDDGDPHLVSADDDNGEPPSAA